MRKIVCLSTTSWYNHPTRKQQVMSRLTDAEILYFNPPVTVAAPLKDKSVKAQLKEYKKQLVKPAPNITVYSLPPVLPLYNKNRLINKFNQRRIAAFVRKKMKQHGFLNPLLWIYHPSSVDAVNHIPHDGLVYDCVDRHSAYPGLINAALVDGMEAALVSKCDAVFATSRGLFERLSAINPKTKLIPNGANYELFSSVDAPGIGIPDEFFNMKKPILGFVGALQPCNEYELVAAAAERRPDWNFVFIGAPLPGVDISMLSGKKNIHLLGARPQKELVKYLACFDVCLNLFRSDALTRDVSPLKFYEYLATGKPIVSTPEPQQVHDYADVIYIADGVDGADGVDAFIEKCALAVAENDPKLTELRRSRGKAASWDSRIAEMRKALAENGIAF